jgi:3-dehydroquinate synthase
MLEELEQNCFEDRGFQRLVDFGHTFSPLLEAQSGYRIAHGEAVAIDMALCSAIAREAGLVDNGGFRRIIHLLVGLGLPIHSALLNPGTMRQAMLDATLHRNGSVNLVIPTSIGTAGFVASHDAITDDTLVAAIETLRKFSKLPAFVSAGEIPGVTSKCSGNRGK